MKRTIGLVIGILGIASAASAQESVTLGVFGYQRIEIPPAGGVNLIGYNFTSETPLTLLDIFGTNQLVQSSRSRNADRIFVWNGSAYDNFFQKTDGLFYDILYPSIPTNVVIPNGCAMFLQSADNSSLTNVITISGTVLMTTFEEQVYQTGFVTLANPYPTDINFNSTNFNWSAATANNRSRNADKIYIWNQDSGGYEAFYLNGSRVWTPLIATILDPVLPNGAGAFYEAQGTFTNNIMREFE